MSVTLKEYRAETPTWCPGCGDFGVLRGVQKALVDLGLEPHQVLTVSGIGCSGKFSSYIGSYGFHGLHGRSLPVAQAVKLANRDLTVLAVGGDGDGYGIGVGHLVHAIRRNVDITYVVMNNDVYGLTVGQTAPTAPLGQVTRSAPYGSSDTPVQPLSLALGMGGGFIAQGFSGSVDHLAELIAKAIQHKGFSLVNVFSPCVTFNADHGYDFLRERLVDIDADQQYNRFDRMAAAAKLQETGGLLEGILFEDPERASYDELLPQFAEEPLTRRVEGVPDEVRKEIVAEFSLTGD